MEMLLGAYKWQPYNVISRSFTSLIYFFLSNSNRNVIEIVVSKILEPRKKSQFLL